MRSANENTVREIFSIIGNQDDYQGFFPSKISDNDLLKVDIERNGWKVRFKTLSPWHRGQKGCVAYWIISGPIPFSFGDDVTVFWEPSYKGSNPPMPGKVIGVSGTQVTVSVRMVNAVTDIPVNEAWNRLELR